MSARSVFLELCCLSHIIKPLILSFLLFNPAICLNAPNPKKMLIINPVQPWVSKNQIVSPEWLTWAWNKWECYSVWSSPGNVNASFNFLLVSLSFSVPAVGLACEWLYSVFLQANTHKPRHVGFLESISHFSAGKDNDAASSAPTAAPKNFQRKKCKRASSCPGRCAVKAGLFQPLLKNSLYV